MPLLVSIITFEPLIPGCLPPPTWTMYEAILQLAATATMHCHPPGDTHPPPLIPPFLLAQNLFKMDCAN